MSKPKIVITLISLVLLLGGVGTGVYLVNKPKEATPSKASTGSIPTPVAATPAPTMSPEKTFSDPSGFSFKYASDIKINDVTPVDNAYYSVLSLTSASGGMKITVRDTKYKSIDTWLAGDKEAPKGAKLVTSVSLGTMAAKQYTLSGKLYTVIIDQGVLYLIEGPADSGYWQKAHDLLVKSFSLTTSNTAATPVPSSGSSDTIYEEETVE